MPLNLLQLLELSRQVPKVATNAYGQASAFANSPTRQTQVLGGLQQTLSKPLDPMDDPDTVILGYEPDFKTGQVVPIIGRREFQDFSPKPEGGFQPIYGARRVQFFDPKTRAPVFSDEEYIEDVETGEYYPSRDTEPKKPQVLNRALGLKAYEERRGKKVK